MGPRGARHVRIYCSDKKDCGWYGGDSYQAGWENSRGPDESINFCPRCGQKVIKDVYYIG